MTWAGLETPKCVTARQRVKGIRMCYTNYLSPHVHIFVSSEQNFRFLVRGLIPKLSLI